MDNPKPTHKRYSRVSESGPPLVSSCRAVVRVTVLNIAAGPGGGHRPQPERAGAPRPILDAHIRDCRLHGVPSTRPYNTDPVFVLLPIDGKGGWDRQKV